MIKVLLAVIAWIKMKQCDVRIVIIRICPSYGERAFVKVSISEPACDYSIRLWIPELVSLMLRWIPNKDYFPGLRVKLSSSLCWNVDVGVASESSENVDIFVLRVPERKGGCEIR